MLGSVFPIVSLSVDRNLYLVAYDVSSPRRRRRLLAAIKGYAIGGQKSLYECWLTEAELRSALTTARALLDPLTDRALFLRLDPRADVRVLGVAVAPADGEFFFLE
jgi:CRISPR-associated protein Cas2